MSAIGLQSFCDSIIAKGRLEENDLRELQRDILADGITSRNDADALIGLDQAVGASAAPGWAECLVASLVEFVVWTSRPTGVVDADAARWLIASLGCGLGPTETAVRIAFEVIREADRTDEALVAFVLHAAAERRRREEANEAQERCAA
jgi:hypothetical protein